MRLYVEPEAEAELEQAAPPWHRPTSTPATVLRVRPENGRRARYDDLVAKR